MSERFDPTARSVVGPVFVVERENAHRFRFAIDTGANRTSMRAEFLRLLGLDFFRGYVLNLDLMRGCIALRTGRWWQFWR